MQMKISDLKTTRQWGAVTGLTAQMFQQLLGLFSQSYLALHGQTVAQRQAELQVTPTLTSEEELLLFTLFSVKAGLTYDALGFVSGMNASNAYRNQQLGLQVLEHALTTSQLVPKRAFKDAAELVAYLQNEPEVIFDGLEQRIQRPSDDAVQRDFYSGKKSVTP
jgi:hypothetical protein